MNALREGIAAIGMGMLVAATGAVAQEDPRTLQSAAEAAEVRPPGSWQGIWRVTREDSRLTTRATQKALTLTIVQDLNATRADIDWQADRALCEPPTGDPCEWVGANGIASATLIGPSGLLTLLPVATDGRAHALHLAPTRNGRSRGQVLHPDGRGFSVFAERLP